jgi:hypothetical protein
MFWITTLSRAPSEPARPGVSALAVEYERFHAEAMKAAEAERKATQAREQARAATDGRFVTQRGHGAGVAGAAPSTCLVSWMLHSAR